MKVQIELSPRALMFLQRKAKKAKRSRKNYMELVLTIHAAQMEDNTDSTLVTSSVVKQDKTTPFTYTNNKPK